MAVSLRKKIVAALEAKKYDSLVKLYSNNSHIFRTMISMTYDKKSIISWRAVEAIGLMTKEISATNPEFVRNLVGRLLWMIRDESGGIGWSAPEILGEIVRNNPESCSDIVSILISFHEEEMLCSGVLWAMGRIGETRRDMVLHEVPVVSSYINHPDTYISGMAVWSLLKIGATGFGEKLKRLISDKRPLIIYDNGEFSRTTLGEIASMAMELEKRKRRTI